MDTLKWVNNEMNDIKEFKWDKDINEILYITYDEIIKKLKN